VIVNALEQAEGDSCQLVGFRPNDPVTIEESNVPGSTLRNAMAAVHEEGIVEALGLCGPASTEGSEESDALHLRQVADIYGGLNAKGR
jgi:hypothetical protein